MQSDIFLQFFAPAQSLYIQHVIFSLVGGGSNCKAPNVKFVAEKYRRETFRYSMAPIDDDFVSRSNTVIFRSVAYGFQNRLGRCATFVFRSCCSLVSASSRNDDVFPGTLLDLARRLLGFSANPGRRLGFDQNLPSASEVLDAC